MHFLGKAVLLPMLSQGQQETPEATHDSTLLPPEMGLTSDLESRRLTPDPEETLWLNRARTGDLAAFDWLMTRYRERAVRLAAHILRRTADAEDLAQEAFLRAFCQIREFRGEAAFYTWLYRIIVRLCLNRMRTPLWQREHSFWGESDYLTSSEQSETRLLIENLLDSLSPPLRAALVLRELEGLDYTEIAETLQIPVGTVRSRLNAARLQFRTLWERAHEETRHV
jgi:RNA polymerase sigma-70 factor (ECF subfamily)